MSALTSALVTIRRSPYQAISCIMMVTVTFFVAYLFTVFLYLAQGVLQHFETRPQIIAFFTLDTPESSIQQLAESMQAFPYVKSVTVVTKQEALELYQQENKNDPLLLELVTADILPASLEVSGVDIQSLNLIKSDLEDANGIDDVVYQQDIVESLARWTRTLRATGLAAVIILGVISFLSIMVLIAIKAAHQKISITIMRLIGATKWYVRSPFVVEGGLYGLFGSLLGWIAMYAAVLYLSPHIGQFLGDVQVLPIPIELLAGQLAAGTTVGVLLGAVAGSLAVGRLIKK